MNRQDVRNGNIPDSFRAAQAEGRGYGFRIRKVKLARALEQADKALEEIRALDERPSDPPPLHLNAHCQTCVFTNSCRATAIEKDDLSLLRGIKENEIVKLRSKGIFTVTQLSYTFRPRKNSKRTNPRTIKYYHALKALALRERRIYVVGKPELTITGTPVYIDTSKERPIATPTISLASEFQAPPPLFNDLFGRNPELLAFRRKRTSMDRPGRKNTVRFRRAREIHQVPHTNAHHDVECGGKA